MLIPMTLAGVLLAGGAVWWLTPQSVVAWVIAGVLLLFVLWGYWFFRDPDRRPSTDDPEAVISPADGKVIKVDMAELPKELQAAAAEMGVSGPLPRVSIFLNLFDVHVNRSISAGQISKIVYSPGQFVNASFDKASELNERSVVLMRDPRGRVLGFAQIAGLVARRIVNHLREGQTVAAGERFGLIRFGSRAEIWMPPGTEIRVSVGQRVRAGETVIGVRA